METLSSLGYHDQQCRRSSGSDRCRLLQDAISLRAVWYLFWKPLKVQLSLELRILRIKYYDLLRGKLPTSHPNHRQVQLNLQNYIRMLKSIVKVGILVRFQRGIGGTLVRGLID